METFTQDFYWLYKQEWIQAGEYTIKKFSDKKKKKKEVQWQEQVWDYSSYER